VKNPTPSQADVGRFWSKVDKSDGCWLWKGALFRNGYGAFGKFGTSFYAHRIAYELTNGPIPYGLTIDHLCFRLACVNPSHLEAVTMAVNARRGLYHRYGSTPDACRRGHPRVAYNKRGQCPQCLRQTA
jgi:hypothetical protein